MIAFPPLVAKNPSSRREPGDNRGMHSNRGARAIPAMLACRSLND